MSRAKRKFFTSKIILAIAVALLVPLSFFVIAKITKKDKIDFPGYYQPIALDTLVTKDGQRIDTLYRHVKDLTLTNQLGKQVSLNKDLSGKILVVTFFFARCPDLCPRVADNIYLLQKAFEKNPRREFEVGDEVHFVSISVDPVRDSVEVLRSFANNHHADHDRWWFLTGDRDSIYDYARNQLGLAVQPSDGGVEELLHTSKIVLLDARRHIRGYYDGLDSADIKRCADDIVLLALQKNKKK